MAIVLGFSCFILCFTPNGFAQVYYIINGSNLNIFQVIEMDRFEVELNIYLFQKCNKISGEVGCFKCDCQRRKIRGGFV